MCPAFCHHAHKPKRNFAFGPHQHQSCLKACRKWLQKTAVNAVTAQHASVNLYAASKHQLKGAPGHVGKQTGRLKSVMMELRKCCNHPFLIDEQEWPVTRDPKQFLQQLVQASGKLALMDSMLERMKERGHRVLIYSQFTTLLDLLEEWLTARQWGYQRIDGSVSGADRQSRIDQFNRRPADNFVFLLSTKAGGLGINLASADTVIIYDSDWNPHNDLQAQARAHRLGQLKPVMMYRLATPIALHITTCERTIFLACEQPGLVYTLFLSCEQPVLGNTRARVTFSRWCKGICRLQAGDQADY